MDGASAIEILGNANNQGVANSLTNGKVTTPGYDRATGSQEYNFPGNYSQNGSDPGAQPGQ